jgi:small subunit ribosomal protein S6
MSTNYYEQIYIINPVLDDEKHNEIVDNYRNLIEESGGEIDEVDVWGNRKLAYEMDGKASGYYVNTYFEAPGEFIADLERAQRIDDNVMRYLTLKYDAKMLRHRELQKKGDVPQLLEEQEDGEE